MGNFEIFQACRKHTADASQLLNVSNCIVTGNSYGIDLTAESSQVTIDNCRVTNNTSSYGIFVAGSQHTLSNNDVSFNSNEGIFLSVTQNNTLQDNTVSNNVTGIRLFNSSSNPITGNTIWSNSDTGIKLVDSSANAITGNTLQSNTNNGINLVNSTGNPMQQNNISLNSNGIYLEQSSTGNTIASNNITQNTINLYNDQPDALTATNNWWGTTICSTIDAAIHDNEEGDGEITYDPVLDAAYPTGVSTSCTNPLPLVVDVGPGCTAGLAVYPEIVAALANASSGDTIVVCPGSYTEMFTLTINLNDLTITAFASDPNLTVVSFCNQPVPPPTAIYLRKW